MTAPSRLTRFVAGATRIVEQYAGDEAAMLADLKPLLAGLVSQDDWLPDAYATPDPKFYRQYLLYGDPLERLSIVSFVWGPGQKTPVHDHMIWGLVGMLRGAEIATDYAHTANGALMPIATHRLEPGAVAAVSPAFGDIHSIANAYDDRPSISIHVYGGNIGRIRRSVYDPATGAVKSFISGYSNTQVPNLWAPV